MEELTTGDEGGGQIEKKEKHKERYSIQENKQHKTK